MARPKKKTDERLSSRLPTTQCTPDDLATIRVNAARTGMSVTSYIRHIARYGEVVIQERDHDFQTVDQLRRIGVNLNQLTKVANATGEVSPALQTVCTKLDAILDHILETI